ncbi:MAG TPA: CehA/McbA family metallohydrolase, partial [Candidatus Faecousia faecigallinarum]|nr:CehA/McbA family metallohydrolase [Candidatus Faecousia faecigallinarum]
MRSHTRSRILSWLLIFAMVLTMAPAAVMAADSATYTKISTMDELTTGQYVAVVNTGYALGALDGTWLGAEAVTPEGDTVADPAANLVWTITVDGAAVKLTDSNGVTIAPNGGNNNGISAGDYLWAVTCTDGTFRFAGQGEDTVTLASNKAQSNKFRAYKNSTVSSNSYPADFTLYKLDGQASGPLSDGQEVVIYAPAHMKALSGQYSGFYNQAVDVAMSGTSLSGYGDTEVWTVQVNDDGSYSFSYDGQNIGMQDSYTSMPLGSANDRWVLEDAGNGLYYVKNTVRNAYMQYQDNYGTWSAYYTIGEGSEGDFALAFYPVSGDTPAPGGLPEEGDQVMLYNLAAEGVLALQDDNVESPSINNAPATISGGEVTADNGGLVFIVEKNGEYFRFRNETYGYLCSNGTGNNAFYQAEATEDADWTLATQGSGFTLESRTAKFNGRYAQYLEYYGGSYKTYSMYNVTDYDIYTFQFYPCANGQLSGGVVNQPAVTFGALADAYVGAGYTFTFTVNAVFGVKELNVTVSGTDIAYTEESGVYTVTVPADQVTGETLEIVVSGLDNQDVAFSGQATVTVKDEPVISDLTPAAGSETGENLRPTIGAAVDNAGENPTISMTVNGQTVQATYAGGRVSYTPDGDMTAGRTTVTLTVTRADGKSATRTWSFTVGEAQYQLYFGQLHSHTTYSDGSGSLETALEYIGNLPESANVDFVAFTDHSNYFDASGAANPEGALYDMSLATASSQALWSAYKTAVADFNAAQSDVVAIAGFEMTWSGGPGHINTFNTPGIVSRNNTTLNSKTNDAGMKAYYALLSQPEGADSISQFNHPGDTFGTFTDFAYWDALIDTRIQLVEVGNGEGQIGAGGYYPSYEYYIMALDKGWHVAPSNNQDNHKGKWGNANDARDVILTDDFSEEGIYQAIRDRRVYATEDKNLEILYTVNGNQLGSVLEEVPEELNLNVQVYDPDATDSISKVEVVVNSGKVAYTWDDPATLAAGELTCTLEPTYSYYFIRVTQGDGDLAVTAPVWVGETMKLGISSVTSGTSTPVTGEALTLTTTLFNSESTDATVKSITYTTNGSVVLGTDTTGYTVPASGTLAVDWTYTPDTARVMTITANVVMELDGVEYTFTMDVELDVLDADSLVYIGIDASHYNEYVAGNYKDSMGNFGQLAAGYSVRTVELATSQDLLDACQNADGKFVALILTAPSRRDGSSLRDPYATYSDAEIQAIVDFNQAGGVVILAGWSDYYESYADFPAEDHMAAQQNKLLAALGSSLRIGDDATNDDSLNGGQTQRLYLSTYNWDSFLMDGVEFDPENPNDNMYSQLYSQYGGASVYVVDAEGNATTTLPETVTPVVYGHDTTYVKDSDGDGLGADTPKYPVAENDNRLMVLATEELENQGLIIVSGAAFMSNFEVQATVEDSGAEKNYSNYNICENLVQYLNPETITPIAQVQAQTEAGYKYTIQGVVTSNASGYDQATAFFDCIYVQDETGGVCCFPVAGNYQIGDLVQITGVTDFYQGELELQVSQITLLGHGEPVAPKAITAQELNDGSVTGMLVSLTGTVESFELANGLVQTIMVRDAQGQVGRVFIDGYITTEQDVENLEVGCAITVTGLASYDDTFNAPEGPFPRIRVRDRADVVCTASTAKTELQAYYDNLLANNQYSEEGKAQLDAALAAGLEALEACQTSEEEAAALAEAKAALDAVLTYEEELEAMLDAAEEAATTAAKFYALFALATYADKDDYAEAQQAELAAAIEAGNQAINAATSVEEVEAALAAAKETIDGIKTLADLEAEKPPFTDVAEGAWYYDAVKYVYNNGLFQGVSETIFRPESPMNRAMVVTVL